MQNMQNILSGKNAQVKRSFSKMGRNAMGLFGNAGAARSVAELTAAVHALDAAVTLHNHADVRQCLEELTTLAKDFVDSRQLWEDSAFAVAWTDAQRRIGAIHEMAADAYAQLLTWVQVCEACMDYGLVKTLTTTYSDLSVALDSEIGDKASFTPAGLLRVQSLRASRVGVITDFAQHHCADVNVICFTSPTATNTIHQSSTQAVAAAGAAEATGSGIDYEDGSDVVPAETAPISPLSPVLPPSTAQAGRNSPAPAPTAAPSAAPAAAAAAGTGTGNRLHTVSAATVLDDSPLQWLEFQKLKTVADVSMAFDSVCADIERDMSIWDVVGAEARMRHISWVECVAARAEARAAELAAADEAARAEGLTSAVASKMANKLLSAANRLRDELTVFMDFAVAPEGVAALARHETLNSRLLKLKPGVEGLRECERLAAEFTEEFDALNALETAEADARLTSAAKKFSKFLNRSDAARDAQLCTATQAKYMQLEAQWRCMIEEAKLDGAERRQTDVVLELVDKIQEAFESVITSGSLPAGVKRSDILEWELLYKRLVRNLPKQIKRTHQGLADANDCLKRLRGETRVAALLKKIAIDRRVQDRADLEMRRRTLRLADVMELWDHVTRPRKADEEMLFDVVVEASEGTGLGAEIAEMVIDASMDEEMVAENGVEWWIVDDSFGPELEAAAMEVRKFTYAEGGEYED